MSEESRKRLSLSTKNSEQRPGRLAHRAPIRGGQAASHKPHAKTAGKSDFHGQNNVGANSESEERQPKKDYRRKKSVKTQEEPRRAGAANHAMSKPRRAEHSGDQRSSRPSSNPRREHAAENRVSTRSSGKTSADESVNQRQAVLSSVKEITPAQNSTAQQGVRVSKLMAERGMCSRREADHYIEQGWVRVNGVRMNELGTRVDVNAEITLDKPGVFAQKEQVTIILHKPVGYVSGQPEPGYQPAVLLVKPENQYSPAGDSSDKQRLFHPKHLKGLAPAGRLDIDSTGLLVLTQNGRVARQLIGENSTIDKEYLVRIEGALSDAGLALLREGLSLDGVKLKRAMVEWANEDQLRFVLREGRKRQIRRMCELVGVKVVGLKRVRMGKIRLGDLPVGKWRYLKPTESF